MVKQDLVDRSPVRFLEKATNIGLNPGEIGVITSRKGLGKTSVLVQLGLDMLFQDKQVVHVSFNQQTDFVMRWYGDIFAEIAKRKNLADAEELKNEMTKKRIILNFNQDVVSATHIVKTLKALAEGGVKTDCLIIDGVDFTKVKPEAMKQLKEYSKDNGVIIWFSCNSEEQDLSKMFPETLVDSIDIVIHLVQKPDSIKMDILKIRDEDVAKFANTNLKLDSKTLLIAEK